MVADRFNIRQVKTFVFDADGVVCTGSPFSVALEVEHHIPRERLAPFFKGPFAACMVGKQDLRQAIAPYLAEWGWRDSTDHLLDFWFRTENVVNSKVIGCVRELRRRGHACVLATNQEKYRAEFMRREMGLDHEFDRIFVSCDIGFSKPSDAFFTAIETMLEQAPEMLCLIDDSEANTQGAQTSGWDAIHYRGPDDLVAVMNVANQSMGPTLASDTPPASHASHLPLLGSQQGREKQHASHPT